MENHFTESEEATSAPSLLVHFRVSFHRISRESLLSEKLFGRVLTGFSRESGLGPLPNWPLDSSGPPSPDSPRRRRLPVSPVAPPAAALRPAGLAPAANGQRAAARRSSPRDPRAPHRVRAGARLRPPAARPRRAGAQRTRRAGSQPEAATRRPTERSDHRPATRQRASSSNQASEVNQGED
jgi:hypothetical protein